MLHWMGKGRVVKHQQEDVHAEMVGLGGVLVWVYKVKLGLNAEVAVEIFGFKITLRRSKKS